MRIGFEAKRAFKNYTGLGNYSRFVIQTLAQKFPNYQYHVYTTDLVKNPRTSFLFNCPNIILRTAPVKLFKAYWRSKGVVNDLIKDKIEVYHGLSHEIPSGLKKAGIKSVVTIHDLIYLRFPYYFKAIDRKIYDLKFKSACANADKIIAISEQTKKDIIHFFNVDEDKIEVVYQDCDGIFHLTEPADKLTEIKNKYQLPKKYILSVGTIESRKNQLLILKALLNLPENIHVVLVGKHTDYAQILINFIELHQLENRVHFLQNADFKDLPAIYQQAKVFVYPSVFEGFGIPILEALNSGVPVIAVEGSCLEEAGGPNSLYVDKDDAESLAKNLLEIYQNEALREEMAAKGKKFALNFRADKIASQLMRVYHKTVNHA
ncbi:MAG: glycosyltransferase family 4 protein [Sphingobacteriales bacterium]|nr:glycosyltransferase family 4 protein [Sphingobacteriales bacterium]